MNRCTGLQRGMVLFVAVFLLLFSFVPPTAAAESASEKLRVFVQPVSGEPPKRGSWRTPEKQFVAKSYQRMEKIIRQKGFYEVVPLEEVRAVLKNSEVPYWKWKREGWAMVRQTGLALGADYAMVIERNFEGILIWRLAFINLNSGRAYSAQRQLSLHGPDVENNLELQRDSFREIFREANGDMFSTAIRKGRLSVGERKGEGISASLSTAPRVPSGSEAGALPAPLTAPAGGEGTPARAPVPVRPPAATLPASSGAPPLPDAVDPGKAAVRAQTAKPAAGRSAPAGAAAERARLIVYDFEAEQRLGMAGLILAEALREELHRLGRFTLINREDMAKVLEEQKLQQSGLLDEKGVVEMGKWLMAGEIVTGKLLQLGNTSVLQARRTDLRTMDTRAIASLKTAVGKEEELLEGMSSLARRLAELP